MKRYRVDEDDDENNLINKNQPLQANQMPLADSKTVAATETLNNNDKTPCDSVRRRDKKAEQKEIEKQLKVVD